MSVFVPGMEMPKSCFYYPTGLLDAADVYYAPTIIEAEGEEQK